MSGIEVIERIVRVVAVLTFLALAWVCLGGESWFAVSTPISSFLMHLVIFFFLSAVSFVGWVDQATRMVILMVALAVILEVVQIALPGRNFSILDLAGNLIGVGVAWIFYRVLLNFKRTIRA